jgi:DNA gyrase inhibitor GyrI
MASDDRLGFGAAREFVLTLAAVTTVSKQKPLVYGCPVSCEQQVTIVERENSHVMFKRAADEQQAITRAWAELEDLVGSLRSRKFYGVFDEQADEYRACVQLREDEDPEALGLSTDTLPGGRYARVRLEGEPPAVYALIAPTFEKLAQRRDYDPTRPAIEFYRRRDVIELLLPVA